MTPITHGYLSPAKWEFGRFVLYDNCGVSTNCGKGNEFYWEFGFKNYHRALVFKNQAQFVLIFGIKWWGVGFQMAKISYEFNQERHIAVLLHLIKSLWSIDDHEQSLKNPGVFVASSSTFTGRHVPFFYNWGCPTDTGESCRPARAASGSKP